MEDLERKINEQINSEYWQSVINYQGFSQQCDLEVLDYNFDIVKLSFYFRVRYIKDELQFVFKPNELGVTDVSIQNFNIKLLRTKIAEKIIKQQLEYYNGELPCYMEHNKNKDDKKGENVMKKLYVKIDTESILV